MNATNAVEETLSALRKAQQTPNPLLKTTYAQPGTATSGLNYYDLEPGAKLLYPVLTPLRNETPRVSGKGGIQANWRAVTAINSGGNRAGVSEGNRGGVIAVNTADYTASYRGIGMESNLTWEAEYAAEGFEEMRALAAMQGLQSLMLQEEPMILGGNGAAVALGTTPTVTATGGTTGGGLSDGTYSVICVALTLDGVLNGTVAGGIQANITRTNADGSSDTFGGGAAQKSVAGSATLSAGTAVQKVTASVTAVAGALGYAWFWGTSGNEVLGAITSGPSYVITATATGTQTAASLPSADWSKNALAFDGLLYQAFKTGSNAYVSNVAAKLTSDSAGGVVEIDAALKDRWDNYRLSPDTIWVNSQQALDLSKLIMAGGNTGAQRFVFNSERDMIGGGIMIRSYLNRFSMGGGQALDIKIHPNLPAGCILMTSKRIPYPLSNVGNVFQIRTRKEYYQIEWPLRSRKYEYGVYADQVLQHYFPPSMAVLTNITAGV